MPIERKLAAIMFTDIAGYTALSAKDSTKASKLLKIQKDTLKPIVEKHGGSWMKEIGDGLLLTFDSATSAVECSIAIQDATKDIEDLNLRIGIHEGEVIKQDGDVIGDDVNVASRIEPFSAVGGVAISDKIYRAISSNQEFETKYVGKPKLKGVSQKVEVYCITSHGLPETDVSKVSAKLEQESKFNIFTLTGGILTAIGVAFWIAVGVFDFSFGGKTEVPSVGILMMENLGIEDEEFWSSGMTNDLITKVAGAGLIRVAPLKEILNLDKELSIEEIAKKLRVKYILTHSFLIKDEGFDLWCKLENIENGVALFSNKISEPMSMTTQMVGKLANDIINSLKVETVQDIMKAPTANAEAYEYYLQGRYKWENAKNKSDIEMSIDLVNKSIEIDSMLIIARNQLGYIYQLNGETDISLQIFIDALKIAEHINDLSGIAFSLKNIAWVYLDKGNTEEALKYFEQSYKISKELGDESQAAYSLNRFGIIHWTKGNYDKSIEYYDKSLPTFITLKDDNGIMWTKQLIGVAYYYKGNYEDAIISLNESLIVVEEMGFKKGIAEVLTYLGAVNLKIGQYKTAKEYLDKAFKIRKKIETPIINSLQTSTLFSLSNKYLNIQYDEKEIHTLIKETENIEFELNYAIYQLLEDTSYLETAYNQIQEKANDLEPDVKAKFLSYPIPKAIIEEWEKVK